MKNISPFFSWGFQMIECVRTQYPYYMYGQWTLMMLGNKENSMNKSRSPTNENDSHWKGTYLELPCNRIDTTDVDTW